MLTTNTIIFHLSWNIFAQTYLISSVIGAEFGEPCYVGNPCVSNAQECIAGRCDCIDYFAYNAQPVAGCFPVSSHEKPCTFNLQCQKTLGQSSTCSPDKEVCICYDQINPNVSYSTETKQCHFIRKLTDPCIETEECYLGSLNRLSTCVNSACQCFSDFVGTFELNGVCYADKKVGHPCKDSQECLASIGTGAGCLNSKCICVDGHSANDQMTKCSKTDEDPDDGNNNGSGAGKLHLFINSGLISFTAIAAMRLFWF